MKKRCERLFIVIQPLQYLQMLELKSLAHLNTLVVLGTDEGGQLKKLIDYKEWDRVIWLKYNGTFVDIIKHRKYIKQLLKTFISVDGIIVSSYYNEFINMVINYLPTNNIILLEDGVANLLMDDSIRYKTVKFYVKKLLCRLVGFDVSPMQNIKLFTVFEADSGRIPNIASEVIVNKYKNIKNKLGDNKLYVQSADVYFLSSAFIKCKMISKKDYMQFLIKLANQYYPKILHIILHRFDNVDDFFELKEIKNINIVPSTGPVELFFFQNKINPSLVITAGSGATETLKLIYGVQIDVIMPKLEFFNKKFRQNMEQLALHFKSSHSVKFL